MTTYGTAYVRADGTNKNFPIGDVEVEDTLEKAQAYVDRFGTNVLESTHGRLKLIVVTIEEYYA
jgi:hypothetical protein